MIAKGSGYVRGNRETSRARLGTHLKYTEHRSMDEEKKHGMIGASIPKMRTW